MLDPLTAEELFRRPASEVHAAIQALQAGADLMKCGHNGRLLSRFIRVNEDSSGIFWQSRKKSLSESTIFFSDIDRVQLGMHTSAFARLPRSIQERDEARAFSIICSGGRTLDLIVPSESVLETWHTGLQAFLLHQRSNVEDSDVSKGPAPLCIHRWC